MAKNKTKTKTKTKTPKAKTTAPTLRNRILKFAVSAAEETRIRDRASSAGMKLSAFIRSKLA